MLRISNQIKILDDEIELSAIRAQGAGGQNVNKVSTAIHLRFDIQASGLPEVYKQRLLNLSDQRINKQGVVIIKAQKYRSLEKNREDALKRLKTLICNVVVTHKKRKPTKPTKGSKKKRLDLKSRRGKVKASRGKVTDYNG